MGDSSVSDVVPESSKPQRWTAHQGWIIAGILLFSASIRIAAAFEWHRNAIELRDQNAEVAKSETIPAFRLGDSLSYWTLADHLAHGRPYEYGSSDASVFRAPLYPLFLLPFTGFDSVDAGVLVARFAGVGLSCLSVWLVILIANRMAGFRSAAMAGILASLHPGSIGMSVIVLSEALFMPLMMGALWYVLRAFAIQTRNPLPALGFGICSGLAVLARPSWLLFIPFLAVISCILGPNRKHILRISTLAVLGFCTVMAPWWIRNVIVTGRFVPTTLQVGLSLYDGLHQGATGASDEGMNFAFEIQAEQRALDQATPPAERVSTFEYRVDSLAKRKAVDWAFQHPSTVVTLAAHKFARTWSLWPDGGDVGSASKRFVITSGTFGILLFAILGSWIAWPKRGSTNERQSPLPSMQLGTESHLLANGFMRREAYLRWQLFLCWLPCLYFTLLHMVFVGSVRYREPAVFVLCVVGGIGLERVWTSFVQPTKRSASSVNP